MAADYSFSFTYTAAADLDETLNYISGELRNPIAAQSFLQKMETAISAITERYSQNNGRQLRFVLPARSSEA